MSVRSFCLFGFVSVLGFTVISCSSDPLPLKNNQGLNREDLQAVEQIQKERGPDAKVAVAVVNGDQTLTTKQIAASEIVREQNRILRADPNATITLDYPVAVNREAGLEPDEKLLFQGKQEFGLNAWETAYPEADGRNVRVAVVDDGVSLGRPGLMKSSIGGPKIVRSINISPLWQMPIRDSRPSECKVPEPATASLSSQWNLSDVGLPKNPRIRMPFDLTPCGINPDLERTPKLCVNWDDLIPAAEERKIGGRLAIAAVYVEYSDSKAYVLVDIDGDNRVSNPEILRPISSDEANFYTFSNGQALGFDVHETAKILPPSAALDHVLRPCPGETAPARTLNVVMPETGNDFGSHGEGVASIAAGHRIAGRNFDGVAPGAQVVDVHFADGYGGRRYTISEIGRALKIGALHADVVNLSYSVFYTTPASQLAMAKLLEALFKDTQALYFFSAGNNGPGRGSMNRALEYPSMGIPVAAFLNAEMNQSTFGSAYAMGGVATYSSRGPSPDGASGALVLSPLAGMVASTPDEGFGPFSGTSSATPAMAGFAARVLSQIRAEGLPFNRALLKKAIIESATPLEGVPFIDQGYGIPKLKPAMDLYRQKLAIKKQPPTIDISAGRGSNGVAQRGVYIRGLRGLEDVKGFNLAPVFSSKWSGQDEANYAEHLKLSSNANWISFPKNVLLSSSGTRIDIAILWNQLERQGHGEYLTEIKLTNADTDEIRGVIPVTILVPLAENPEGELTIDVPVGENSRIFLQRPNWATHLLVSRETTDPRQKLCGNLSFYSPSGERTGAISKSEGSAFMSDAAFATDAEGVYELISSGHGNHRMCPAPQKQRIRYEWFQVSAQTVSSLWKDSSVELRLQVSTSTPRLAGALKLSNPGADELLIATETETTGEWKVTTPVQLNANETLLARLDPEFAKAQTALLGLPYWYLSVFNPEDHVMPSDSQLGMGSDWGTVNTPDFKNSTVKAEFTVSSFDLGIQRGYLPSSIPLWLRRVSENASSIKGTAGGIQVRNGDPAAATVSLSGDPNLLKGKSMFCEFEPARFRVTVPCGSVTILR